MAERGCLQAWTAESKALARRWQAARCSGAGRAAEREVQQLRGGFGELLLRMRGLPAALPTLPLELTVLYNSLLFTMGASDSATEGESEGIHQGLLRVLEACGACRQDLSTEKLWQKVLREVTVKDLQAPLHRLGALQAVWWLSAGRLGSTASLFRLLSNTEDTGRSHCHEGENELLSLLKAWRVPAENASLPLLQRTEDLKEILCTTAACLQALGSLLENGPDVLEKVFLRFCPCFPVCTAVAVDECAGGPPQHLLLPLFWAWAGTLEAARGFCSKRVLAQIYTCLGFCAQRMGKPQTALQHLKQALQVDFQCFPALSHMAAVYHELGETDVELQALALLDEALEEKSPAVASSSPYFLIQTELLLHTPILALILRHRHPSEVKYLLAQRCLQDGREADAAEHYLDFLALLQEGLQQQVPLDCSSALPRIPEVFLEAASALEQAGRHQDAITMCEEVIRRTTDLIPRILRVEERLEECPSPGAGLAGGLLSQKKESLCCLAWRTAAYLHQGWAWANLGERKEAITQFSRCLSDLLRVQLYGSGVELTENLLPELEVLQKIRLLSLIGRGVQFLELGRHKEALLDFHSGLQTLPGDPAAASYLVQALWKLNQKQEAAAHWQKFSQGPPGQERQGRPFPLYLVSCVKQAMFPDRDSLARSIQDYLRTTKDPLS